MSYQPESLQILFLWRLLAGGGGEFWKNIKPQIDAKDRKALESAGLITVDKRKEPDGKGARAILHVSLSEQGWAWAAENLDAEFSKTTSAAPVLHLLMGRLKAHLARTGTSLADFVCPQDPTEPQAPAAPERETDLADAVRSAYGRASAGRWNVRVRLADLRRQLEDLVRERLDEALLAMEREGSLVLYPLDDPREIGPEDEAAGLPNSLGILRHIVYMEK